MSREHHAHPGGRGPGRIGVFVSLALGFGHLFGPAGWRSRQGPYWACNGSEILGFMFHVEQALFLGGGALWIVQESPVSVSH